MAVQFLKVSSQSGVITGYKGISGSQNRTICFWFKGSFAHFGQIFGWGTESSNQRFIFESEIFGGNNIFLSTHGRYKGWVPGNMFDGNWHWVCLTLDGTTNNDLDCYLDNVLLTTGPTNSGTINTGNFSDVEIGDGPNATWNSSDSNIFDFRIYNRAITSDERLAIFSNGNGCDIVTSSNETKLRFGAESGLLVQEIDLSGNGNDGFPVNAPEYIADPFSPCGGIISNRFNRIAGLNEGRAL